ncbi:MAG: NUDIX hydrolase [Candidatus Saccharibacteria bacterium]
MSIDTNIHPIQTSILRELLFRPSARFAELQKTTALDSDHFKFHISKLVELGHIVKNSDGSYSLTSQGKEYANKLDTENSTIERQPKAAVILVVENDQHQFLVQERLKHPYYGFWGFPGGKIRWGETIMAAAARELLEETDLTAELTYRGVYHERVQLEKTSAIVEDKIFHIVSGSHPDGELTSEFDGGRNAWLQTDDIIKKDKIYKSFGTELAVGIGSQSFVELIQTYDTTQF